MWILRVWISFLLVFSFSECSEKSERKRERVQEVFIKEILFPLRLRLRIDCSSKEEIGRRRLAGR